MVFCNKNNSIDEAIELLVTILILVDGFLQFYLLLKIRQKSSRHNPYFSRWFSAIDTLGNQKELFIKVTILILVDGFLQ